MAEFEKMSSMRDINDYCVGKGLYTLSQGMIEIPPSKALREAAADVMRSDEGHCYRARLGEVDYLEAVSNLLTREGVQVPAGHSMSECVLATQGVTAGIVSSILHLQHTLGRQPRIALLEPYYTYHAVQIKAITGLPAVSVKNAISHETGRLNIAPVQSALADVDAVIMCNPHNPLGIVWEEEDVEALFDTVVVKGGKFLVCDECYSEMAFKKKHCSPIQKRMHDNVVVCRGFSKTLGAQSWRIGYAVSSPATLASLVARMDPYYVCVPILQHAVGRYLLDNLSDFDAHVSHLNSLIQENWIVLRDAFLHHFPTWKAIEPHGTMYGNFVHDQSTDLGAVGLCLQAGVGVCPGSMFTPDGMSKTAHTGTVRIHCGVSREKAQAIAAKLRSS
eukprot:TRINITY_DN17093_c0_g1_i1.p1 TRINITY_DN17093_c0_g1~~TRINITY_DN17093_c0_g1_i1.p1  ORF type:complete len:390 (+),score=162.53 TRINITY_DN17093_c0_g1_i1:70-1239(+)